MPRLVEPLELEVRSPKINFLIFYSRVPPILFYFYKLVVLLQKGFDNLHFAPVFVLLEPAQLEKQQLVAVLDRILSPPF